MARKGYLSTHECFFGPQASSEEGENIYSNPCTVYVEINDE
jgi:hypothetical protein